MGYRIQYPGNPGKIPEKKLKRVISGALIFLTAVLLLLPVALPPGREILTELMVPGDAQETAAAMECFLQDMRQGEEFGKACHSFYETVIGCEQ